MAVMSQNPRIKKRLQEKGTEPRFEFFAPHERRVI